MKSFFLPLSIIRHMTDPRGFRSLATRSEGTLDLIIPQSSWKGGKKPHVSGTWRYIREPFVVPEKYNHIESAYDLPQAAFAGMQYAGSLSDAQLGAKNRRMRYDLPPALARFRAQTFDVTIKPADQLTQADYIRSGITEAKFRQRFKFWSDTVFIVRMRYEKIAVDRSAFNPYRVA